jgi:glycosyltransferase involved in cell wall biosynthesis
MNGDEKLTSRVGEDVPADKPAVSVIIPNYNTARFISQTLDSVFSQSFRDLEVIVINDGAPDTEELYQVLEPFLPKIIFLDRKINEGTSRARNLAAKYARADVLCFLDGDDIWDAEFLNELYPFLADNGYDMAYADAETFGIGHLTDTNFLKYNPETSGPVTRKMLIDGRCHILPSGTLIRHKIFDLVGGFDDEVRRTEDFDLWMRLAFQGARIGYLRKVLFKFRLRPDSGSGDYLVRLQRCIDVWNILRDKLEFSPDENSMIDRHIAVQESALVRARGRFYLSRQDWRAARAEFVEAKRMADDLSLPLKHRLKLAAVIMALKFSPHIVLKMFRRFRPQEIEYIVGIN